MVGTFYVFVWGVLYACTALSVEHLASFALLYARAIPLRCHICTATLLTVFICIRACSLCRRMHGKEQVKSRAIVVSQSGSSLAVSCLRSNCVWLTSCMWRNEDYEHVAVHVVDIRSQCVNEGDPSLF
jgi:hypothetical protein